MNQKSLKYYFNPLFLLCPFIIFAQLPSSVHESHSIEKKTTFQNVPVELTFNSTVKYADPFNTVEVDAIVTSPDATIQKVPAFWAGGNTWKIRYASKSIGKYSWTLQCSNKNDGSLNEKKGFIEVLPYRGNSINYRSGPLQISKDHRHFEYSNGTPFLWLGDTWWKGLSSRITYEEFKILAADRKAKGFNVVQIVAGPYPDEPAFDPRWANEGGMPYHDNYEKINPAYFDYADRRIQYLVNQGFVPAIVGGWGWHMDSVGVKNFNKHWRYLVALYAAYPVVWIAGGEAGGEEWTAVARNLHNIDPFHRLVTMHSFPGSARLYVTDEKVLDFDMLQTGHGGSFGDNSPYGVWQFTAANTVSKVMSAYSKTPAMPVVLGEVTYEGHMRTNGAEVQRQVFWSTMLSGAAGYTYGAGGIWQMNSATQRGAEYEFTPWFEAMKLPGSTQLGQGKKLLEEYQWWKFEPHPEWVEPHSTTLFEPHDTMYDDSKKYFDNGNRWDLPYAAGIPGKVRIIFIPGHYYDWTAPVIKNLEVNIAYHAFLVDPSSGKHYELGTVINSGDSSRQYEPIKSRNKEKMVDNSNTVTMKTSAHHQLVKGLPLEMHENPRVLQAVIIPAITHLPTGDYAMPRLPAPQDWLLVMERLID